MVLSVFMYLGGFSSAIFWGKEVTVQEASRCGLSLRGTGNKYLSTCWVQLWLKRRHPLSHKCFRKSARQKKQNTKPSEAKIYLLSFGYLGNPVISFFFMFQVTCYLVLHIINNNYSYSCLEMRFFFYLWSQFFKYSWNIFKIS